MKYLLLVILLSGIGCRAHTETRHVYEKNLCDGMVVHHPLPAGKVCVPEGFDLTEGI